MLIISRKKDQMITIGDGPEKIEIHILEVGRNRVRLGLKAAKHIPIQTRVYDGAPKENQERRPDP